MVANIFDFVELVYVSIFFDLGAGDDVPVVPWPGALDVPPGAAVPVSTVPGSFPVLPVNVARLGGGIVGLAWASA